MTDERAQQAEQPPPSEAAEQFEDQPVDSEVEEIEQDREERLDPVNRPEDVEVDNTRREVPAGGWAGA